MKREPKNTTDENDVAVVKTTVVSCEMKTGCAHPNNVSANMEVVGHIPKLMAVWVTKFLKRQTNTAKL